MWGKEIIFMYPMLKRLDSLVSGFVVELDVLGRGRSVVSDISSFNSNSSIPTPSSILSASAVSIVGVICTNNIV